MFKMISLKWIKSFTNFIEYRLKMNLIDFRDKYMPELHLKQPWFIYSACGPFTKHLETI